MTESRRLPSLPLARLLLVALLGLLMAGCTMRGWVSIDVADDGSGTFEVIMAFDEELRALIESESPEPIDWTDPSTHSGEGPFSDMVSELPDGATVEPYSEEGFEGIRVRFQFSSLEELEGILDESEGGSEDAFPFQITSDGSGRFQLTTHGDVFGEAGLGDDELGIVPPSMLESLFDLQVRVRLPGEIVSTNAPETDESGLMIWKLDPTAGDPPRPEAVSQVTGGLSPVPWLVGAAVVIGIGTAIAVARKRSPELSPGA